MLNFFTESPDKLLAAIKIGIDKGHIETWEYDGDGDFTHTPPQWRYKAWLRPVIVSGSLRFGILSRKDIDLSTETYAVYHGRFIEMILAHLDSLFTVASASANLQSPDKAK